MNESTFEIEGFRFNVPEYYQRVPSEPEDPAGSIPLVVQTGQAYCVVLAHHIEEDQRMPYDQEVVTRWSSRSRTASLGTRRRLPMPARA